MPKSSPRSDAVREHTASAVASIRRLVRLLRLAAQHTRSSAGVSAAQLFVLQQLGDDTERSLGELAERTLTDRTSVAAVVERLAERRLVERTVDPTDRRRAAVHITATGRRVLQRAPDAPTTGLISAIESLSPRDVAMLAASLERLIAALGVADEPAPMLFADESSPRPKRGRGRSPKPPNAAKAPRKR